MTTPVSTNDSDPSKHRSLSKLVFAIGNAAAAALVTAVGILLLVVHSVVSVTHSGWWVTAALNLGFALVPAGIVSLSYEYFTREAFVTEMRQQLSSSLRSHFDAVDRLLSAGFVDLHDTLPTSQVARLFATAKEVFIAQTWIPDLVPLLRSLAKAAEKECKIRILLLSPDSGYTQLRTAELGYEESNQANINITANLAELSRFCRDKEALRKQIEVRLYDAMPSACVYRADSTAYVGFFWRKLPAIQGPHIEFRTGPATGSFYGTIEAHFDDLWNAAKPYDLGKRPPAASPGGVLDTPPANATSNAGSAPASAVLAAVKESSQPAATGR